MKPHLFSSYGEALLWLTAWCAAGALLWLLSWGLLRLGADRLTKPADVRPGDLLVLVGPAGLARPAGFTVVQGSTDESTVFYRIADGTETL